MLNIGRMRFRVTYKQKIADPDGTTTTTPTYAAPQGPFWAAIENADVDESIFAEAQRAIVTHVITTRWFANVKESDQLLFTRAFPDGTTESVVFEVVKALDVGELHRELTIYCREVR